MKRTPGAGRTEGRKVARREMRLYVREKGKILRLARLGSLRMTQGKLGADSPGVDDDDELVMPPTNGRRYGETAPLSRFATALPDAGRAKRGTRVGMGVSLDWLMKTE